jgi:hypothetical protein
MITLVNVSLVLNMFLVSAVAAIHVGAVVNVRLVNDSVLRLVCRSKSLLANQFLVKVLSDGLVAVVYGLRSLVGVIARFLGILLGVNGHLGVAMHQIVYSVLLFFFAPQTFLRSAAFLIFLD